MRNSGLSNTSFDTFSYLLSQGYIVLILDGFDEMAAKITPQVTNRNFQQLSRCIKGKSKVILTCRTHYFKSRTEEEEVILGGSKDYGSDSAKDLYWELILRNGFSIAYLRPFTISQVEEYVIRAKGDYAKEALLKIKQTYNLMELSSRPMLLEMIVKSIDSLNTNNINASKLYEIFTDAWIHRDKWRDAISSDAKLKLLMALANSLWTTDSSLMHYKELAQYLHDELSEQIQDPHQLVEIDSEIRTASFLTRNECGYYGFAHKSYLEFFYAKYLSFLTSDQTGKWLHTRRLSSEIISFLHYLVDTKEVESYLEALLTQTYKPYISENALLCLYGFRRERVVCERIRTGKHSQETMQIQLPDKMQLKGAQLSRVNLEGALMRSVDLEESTLCEAILSNTELPNAILKNANLERANFRSSNLKDSHLSSSNLKASNFEFCNLVNSNFSSSVLIDSYFMHAILDKTLFTNCQLFGAVFPDNYAETLKAFLPDDISKQVSNTSRWDKIEKHLDIIRAAAYKVAPFCKNVMEFDEIVSEIIIILASHDSMDRINDLTPAYIYSLAMVRIKYIMSKQNRDFEQTYTELSDLNSDFEDFLSNIPDDEWCPYDYIVAIELADKLSDDAKLIFTYYYIYEYSLKNISEKTGLSIYKIKQILTKTNDFLREYVDEFGFTMTKKLLKG